MGLESRFRTRCSASTKWDRSMDTDGWIWMNRCVYIYIYTYIYRLIGKMDLMDLEWLILKWIWIDHPKAWAGYHLRHALAPISESSLSRVDFWHALMDPSHGSPQDLPRTPGNPGRIGQNGMDGVNIKEFGWWLGNFEAPEILEVANLGQKLLRSRVARVNCPKCSQLALKGNWKLRIWSHLVWFPLAENSWSLQSSRRLNAKISDATTHFVYLHRTCKILKSLGPCGDVYDNVLHPSI